MLLYNILQMTLPCPISAIQRRQGRVLYSWCFITSGGFRKDCWVFYALSGVQQNWKPIDSSLLAGLRPRWCPAVSIASALSVWWLPLLKPDTDALLLDWEVDPIIQFSYHVLQGVSSQFERPFLKASHQLGNVSSTGYQALLRNLLVLVNQWDARPELVVSKSVVYGSIVFDFTQLTIRRILVESLKHTVKTHLMPFFEMKVPTLIRGTNR